jgi:hypothetical protein
MVAASKSVKRSRKPRIFTCDRGRRTVDVDRDPPALLATILQEVAESGFWRELDRFPLDVISRLLPRLSLPRHTRRLLEIWVEERGRGRGRGAA